MCRSGLGFPRPANQQLTHDGSRALGGNGFRHEALNLKCPEVLWSLTIKPRDLKAATLKIKRTKSLGVEGLGSM